mgnify:FL=1
MTRQRVSSSNIASVGYDSVLSILEVEFLNGSVYRYYDVPEILFKGLMSAASHGKYFNALIKNGPYQYEKIY